MHHTQSGLAVNLTSSEGGQHEACNGERPAAYGLVVHVDRTPSRALSESPATAEEPRMRPSMTIDLNTDDMDVFYDSKLSLDDVSPKPCITPGNALHLIDDDPSPRSQTPSSVIIVPADGGHDQDAEGYRSSSEPPPPARPAPRVRFRSRVRITSGMHRHRHSMPGAMHSGSTPSSASDSPSSSISAPLRYQADENTAWGPLGKRLSAYAGGGWQRRVHSAPQVNGGVGAVPKVVRPHSVGPGRANERTPLVRGSRRSTYVNYDDDVQEDEDEDVEEQELRAAALKREHEAMFGKWPMRLVNPRWWWWHLEPILCCLYCSDDYDFEE